MAATYSAIATTTLGSATSSYTFSSIPSSYTDLVLVVSNLTTAAGSQTIYARINGDTGTNYSYTILKGNGTTASSNKLSSGSAGLFLFGYDAGTSTTNPTQIILHILNYANTTTYKTAICRGDLASGEVNATVSLWRSTSAINSVEVRCPSSNMNSGTVLTLYGIKAA